MRKDELEPGVAYVTRHDGKVTVVDLHPPGPRGTASMKVQVRAEADDTFRQAGALFMLSPVLITRRWDDPTEVAKRERKAKLDAQSDRARELLAAMGLTVAYPGRRRSSGTDEPDPQSWVEGAFNGRRVVIALDAFLELIGTADVAKALADGAQTIRVAAEQAAYPLRRAEARFDAYTDAVPGPAPDQG
jgi:hypothetical protein